MSFSWSAVTTHHEDTGESIGKRSKISHTPSSALNTAQHATVTISGSGWDIDGGLAADFEGSLSGLGSDLGANAYNMSEALLALPVFKQENLDNGYQYILGAATSPAVKVNEETLTYLNQGQSYEIKLKKLGDLSDLQGQFLRSVVRISFHERRLQYMEREQLEQWRSTRPGERICEIDVPLSYGITDIKMDPGKLNTVSFSWEPTKEAGVYVKVNCISTEFTAKKHGGEKGVPFRIQVETYTEEDGQEPKLVHCASCQVKVFKPKGADRKHKTDREKMDKRSEADKEKFQPSYDCTVLTEIPVDQVLRAQAASNMQCFKQEQGTPVSKKPGGDGWEWSQAQITTENPPVPPTPFTPVTAASTSRERVISPISTPSPSPSTNSDLPLPTTPVEHEPLSQQAAAKEVTQWLQANRFSNYIRVFQNFSGADLLRLTRDDLILICGLADGIRLNNALQSRSVRPRMTLFVCQEPGTVYHALYLEKLTSQELVNKISQLFSVDILHIHDIFIQGPSQIHILLTDEVVRNFQDQSRFWLEALQDETSEKYTLLLKTIE